MSHAVLIVGYGQTADEEIHDGDCDEYWILRNSWGKNWGEEGFFKLCADNPGSEETPLGTCLINKYAVWPTWDMNDIEHFSFEHIAGIKLIKKL